MASEDYAAASLAAQGARGSDFQETVIQVVTYPAAPTGIIAFALILWGLRAQTDA